MSRGQILERMLVVSVRRGGLADEIQLEALWQPGVMGARGVGVGEAAMPVVIAGPHPWLGGNMDAPVCAEIVWQLARRGHPTIRFNWRGVSASTGVASHDVNAAIEDLESVVEHHAAGGPCALVGVSFGCAAASVVAARHPHVERAVLVAPPVTLVAVDFEALHTSGIPVGVVVGAADTTAPLDAVQAQARARGPVRVEVIEGATHSFTAGLVECGRRVAGFLPGIDPA